MSCYFREERLEQGNVGGQNTAGHCGETTRHHYHQFRLGHLTHIGLNEEWRFSLANENVGGRGESFCPRRTQDFHHDFGYNIDEPLHYAQVIQDAHQGRKKDYGG